MKRFIHNFTIAEIGSLVTFRVNPDWRGTTPESHLIGKVGIVKAIENGNFFGQRLLIDFNYVLSFAQLGQSIGPVIGPIWSVSGDNLLPLPQWIIDGNRKGKSLITPAIQRVLPARGIKPDYLAGPTVGTESTPSAYYFASPPSAEINGLKLSTNKA